MKLIIVRHGQTIENDTGVIQGQQHGKLSELGLKQAEKLGKALKSVKIDFIYSSDLKRTKDTLLPILKYHPLVPVIYDPLVRERNYGIFEGKKKEEVLKGLGPKANEVYYSPPKGESVKQFRNRVKKFLKELAKNHQDKETILICTHGGWKQAFYRILHDITHVEKIVGVDFQNASISEYKIHADGSFKVLALNKTDHLN